jgi:hypothetical protein
MNQNDKTYQFHGLEFLLGRQLLNKLRIFSRYKESGIFIAVFTTGHHSSFLLAKRIQPVSSHRVLTLSC